MKITDNYLLFWGSVFSNWFPCEFTYNGVKFNCSEQAFMYEKAMLFNDPESAKKILEAKDPEDQKSLGRGVRGYVQRIWDEHKFDIMYEVCLAKFEQNEKLKEMLLGSGKRKIVEASPEDRIWGIGLAPHDPKALDEKNWKGTNLLGEALMAVRRTIRCINRQCEGCGDPLILGNMRVSKEEKRQMEDGLATYCPRYFCANCRIKSKVKLNEEDYKVWYSTPL